MGNIKLIKRLIYEIINSEYIKISDLDKIFGSIKDIIHIFEVLCMEYYFNINQNISNKILKANIKNYLLKIITKENNNEWYTYYHKKYTKINKNNLKYDKYLSTYQISKLNNEKKLLTKYLNLFDDIAYDKILYLSKDFNIFDEKEYYIKLYIESIERITDNIKEINKENNFKYLFLSKIINTLYKYYISNTSKKYNEIFENLFISSKIHNNNKQLIEGIIDKDSLFRIDNYYKRDNILLFDYIFKYFDFCLVLLLRKKKKDLFKNWINSQNKIFKFYCESKILSVDKYNNENDYMENFTFVNYLTDLTSCFNKENENVKTYINYKMKINQFNEFKTKDKSNIYNITIKFDNFDENKKKENYNKLAIFTLDNINKEYILQDIIDIYDIKRKNYNSYTFNIKGEIYFVPLKNIPTCLYHFKCCLNKKNKIKGYIKNENIKFTKINTIPKYSWNIGYNGSNYLLLSQENKQIYSFNSSSRIIKFNLYKNLNIEKYGNKEDKTAEFIYDYLNNSSFLLSQNGEIYCIEKNKNIYKWLNDKEKNNNDFPLEITIVPHIKIVCMSVSYNNCYVIDNNGNLYGIEDY